MLFTKYKIMDFETEKSKLFKILIDYLFYYIDFNESKLEFIDNDKIDDFINKIDEEGSNFFHDIVIYTIKTNFKRLKFIDWVITKNININFKNKENEDTVLHILSKNINKSNYLFIIKYINIFIRLGTNIYLKNKNKDTFIKIFKNKTINKEFNFEKEFNLLCFDNNKYLQNNDQKNKIINTVNYFKSINKNYKKENYKKAIDEINSYIYFKNKEYLNFYKNKEINDITYKKIIKFLNVLREKSILYDYEKSEYYTTNTFMKYVLPYIDYEIITK